ncbi:nuclear transport factor 2 family protein [Algoriphagus machipongonensis]|uniref:DUF4440 domain-containing protein n=1 Tax=Algoriphagus machipongonensis TaxID=388413 RepID=A3I2P7_9BACT|nr:DUF4440 domain-containing protein [Algoriphagus machipongonensis]EAZ79351.1 hypothetical protein ALPR1_16923 [Algoriphagus machipongonensis]
MKKLLILGLFIFLGSPSFSQTQQEEIEIIEVLIQESFDSLFSAFNSEKIENYYTEDFLLLEDGEVWNNKIIKEYFDNAIKKQPIPTRVNKFEFIETKVDGDMAWTAYHNYAKISRDGEVIREVHWLESAVAVKTAAGWKLKMLHSTPIRD